MAFDHGHRPVRVCSPGFVTVAFRAGSRPRADHVEGATASQIGLDTVIYYAVSVTAADLIMADGKSLENVGVTPDELLLPTGAELRAQKDPVLSRAIEIAGATLDPVEAGKLFPFKWKP